MIVDFICYIDDDFYFFEFFYDFFLVFFKFRNKISIQFLNGI